MLKITLFFTVFFGLYVLINFYIFIRGWRIIPDTIQIKFAYLIIFFTFSASYIASHLLWRVLPSAVTGKLVFIGSFWFAIMLYLFMVILLFDVASLVFFALWKMHIRLILSRVKFGELIFGIVSCVFIGILLFYGYRNARNITLRTIDVDIPRKGGVLETMNIVMASDIHLGEVIGNEHLDKISALINSCDPDLVLFPGDIVDNRIDMVATEKMGERFHGIKSRYGIYAVTGNHEYIGGVESTVGYLSRYGIIFIRDSVISIADSIYLAGRDDRSISRFLGKERKSLQSITGGLKKNLPVILMDHQPFDLDDASNAGVALQLSGHTHYGQLWPVQCIIDRIYELGYGYMKKRGTAYYVSSGAGTWGPPVRIGSLSEVVHIRLHFK